METRVASTDSSCSLPLAVGFAPVRHTNHVNHGLVVINGVNDAVVADSNAPKLEFAFELLCAVWAGIAAEPENRCVDPLSHGGWQGGELLRGPAANGEIVTTHGAFRFVRAVFSRSRRARACRWRAPRQEADRRCLPRSH